MVNRWRRHLDLLQMIDMEPNFTHHPDEHSSAAMQDRPMHKNEIQRVCRFLDLDTDGTVPELRDRLRDEYIPKDCFGTWRDPKDEKAGSSEFSAIELRRLTSEVKYARRLDAKEVDIWNDIPTVSRELTIETEDNTYTGEFVGKQRDPWKDSWGDERYSEYEMYRLAGHRFSDGRQRRLMVLRDLDTDACKYTGSVVLERKRDYGPYERWKKQSYVRSIDV